MVFDRIPTWQSLSSLHCSSKEQLEGLLRSDYPAIEESPSGEAQPAIPRISKSFVSYLACLASVSPYYGGPCGLFRSDYPAIEASPSGEAQPAIPRISKSFVSYLACLASVSPYYGGPCDDRAKGLPDYHDLCAAQHRPKRRVQGLPCAQDAGVERGVPQGGRGSGARCPTKR